MGSDRSRSIYRGLAYHDPRLDTIWEAQSSYTEQGATAGDPQPQRATDMVLEATGQQDDGSTLRVRALSGGMPGAGPMKGGFGWRPDDVSDWRGWEVPTTSLGWEAVVWTDGVSGFVRGVYHPHALTLADGTVLVAAQCYYVAASASYQVRVWKRDPDTYAWGSAQVHSQSSAWTDGAYPCLVLLPSGRVLCYHWIEDSAQSEAQVRCHISDDDGATWTQARAYVLEDDVRMAGTPGPGANGYELGRLRAAYKDGQVCLTASLIAADTTPNYRATLAQWQSPDAGMSFLVVNAAWNTASRGAGYQEVIAIPSGFALIYICAVNPMPLCRIIGHAADDYEDATYIEVASGSEPWARKDAHDQYFEDGDLAACLDDDGAIYCYGRQVSIYNQGICVRSVDYGATWDDMGQSPLSSGLSTWWNAFDSATYPRAFTATCQRGRVIMAHNWTADPGNEDNSLGALYLGGYSTVTMPGFKVSPTDLDRVSWEQTYLPLDLPSDSGWSASGGGTGVLASGALNISTTGSMLTYNITKGDGTIAEGLLVRAALATVSGGALSADDIRVRLRLADGVDDYDVSIRFAPTGLRLYDNNAGAAVGSATIDTTAGVEVLAAMAGAAIKSWYRARDTSEDHDWIEGPESTALTSDVTTPESTILVSFGHGIASNAETNWYELHYTHDEWTGYISELTIGWANPDDIYPRNFCASQTWIAEGVRVAAIDGPAIAGDEWSIDTHHEWAVERILTADPRQTWRSVGDATPVTIALALDSTLLATAESSPGNELLALGLFGCNFGICYLRGWDVTTSAWVTLATVELRSKMTGMHWHRVGNAIRPANTSGANTPYLFFGEHNGGSFCPDDTTKIRRIAWHTEGRFGGVALVSKRPTLILDGVDGTEGSSGTAGEIWSPDVVVIVKLDGATYAGYQLEIPAQDTADGYFEIGRMILGPVALFGWDYSWGRAIELQAHAEVTRARDLHRTVRVQAAPTRTVEFGWADGLDQTDAWEDTEPDYVMASTGVGAGPAASVADVPQVMGGLLRLLDGEAREVLYLAKIPKEGTTATLIHYDEKLYGTITSPVRVESVQGDEGTDEVVRVATITITEEPRWRPE